MSFLSNPHVGGLRYGLVAVLVIALAPFFTGCPQDRADDPMVVDDRDIDDMPITSVAQLTAPDAQRLEGRDVELFNVEIVQARGDTAFYVVDDRAMAPRPGDQTQPGAQDQQQPGTQPGQQQPGAQPGVGQDDRVLVRYNGGFLGIDMNGDDDVIRVGNRVNIYGTVAMRDRATRDGAMRDDRAAGQTQPGQTQPGQTQPGQQDPAAQPTPATPSPGVTNIYVRADRVERADEAGRAPGAQPGTAGGQTADPGRDAGAY